MVKYDGLESYVTMFFSSMMSFFFDKHKCVISLQIYIDKKRGVANSKLVVFLQIEYKVLEGTDYFSVNVTTGALSCLRKIDREKDARFIIKLEARDSGKPSLHSTVKVCFKYILIYSFILCEQL